MPASSRAELGPQPGARRAVKKERKRKERKKEKKEGNKTKIFLKSCKNLNDKWLSGLVWDFL